MTWIFSECFDLGVPFSDLALWVPLNNYQTLPFSQEQPYFSLVLKGLCHQMIFFPYFFSRKRASARGTSARFAYQTTKRRPLARGVGLLGRRPLGVSGAGAPGGGQRASESHGEDRLGASNSDLQVLELWDNL